MDDIKMREPNHEIREITIGTEIWYHLYQDNGKDKVTVGMSQNRKEMENLKQYLPKLVPVLNKL